MTASLRRWVAAAVAVLVVVVAVVVLRLVASGDDADGAGGPTRSPSPTLEVAPLTPQTALRPAVAALSLVPADAEVVTVTDLDAIRARLGVPDLSSEDLMTDRQAFCERAGREAVLLTDGLLREDASELWLDYDFGEDDVDWEARFTGPSGPGFVLAFRPNQDMDAVQRAVDAGVGPLGAATVWPDLHLLVEGVAGEGEPVWASDPDLVGLVPGEGPRETTYVRRGCIPMAEALGTDATVEDQDAHHDVEALDPLPAVSLSFGGDVAMAGFAPGREDLDERAALLADWPTTGPIGWSDGFADTSVVDAAAGRIGLQVTNPVAAANLTLSDLLPFGVCDDATPMDEPTGQ